MSESNFSSKSGRKKPSRRSPQFSVRDQHKAETKRRALAALALMRRQRISLAEACRAEHIKSKTFLTIAGSAVTQDHPGGRYRATKGDSFRRDLKVPTTLGQITVPIKGSKTATQIAKYQNAVAEYLRTGKTSSLRPFRGKSVVDARGRKVELITDPATLSALATADELKFIDLYGSIGGAA